MRPLNTGGTLEAKVENHWFRKFHTVNTLTYLALTDLHILVLGVDGWILQDCLQGSHEVTCMMH